MDRWRVVERFEVIAAADNGPRSLLIYNTHQPMSKNRPFNPAQQINFCKAFLRDAIRFCGENEQCVGYGFGGDANCSIAVWSAAFGETREHELSFTQPSFMYGLSKKRRSDGRC